MNKPTISALALLLFSAFVIAQTPAPTAANSKPGTPAVTSKKVDHPQMITTASGLQYMITSAGNGIQAHKGDNVKVHYTGKLTDSTIFDSSVKKGVPFDFQLGRGRVIKGWDEGISYLHVGDKATFIVPAALGYGEQKAGSIPPNSTLIFDVELVDVSEGIKSFEIKKHADTLKAANGIQYLKVLSNPKGVKPIDSGKVSINYIAYLKDGSILDASADRGNKPFSCLLGENQGMKGWDECIRLMRVGEKTRFIVPYKLAYGDEGYKGVIPPKADLIFDLELTDAKAPVRVQFYDVKGKDTVKTASGLKYIVVSKGAGGAKAESGKTVKVHYTGFLDNGKIFDSSVQRGDPIEFPLGAGRVIKGWDEGIALMSVGDKFRLIIPYDLAYGESGHPPVIPPMARLIFDVELVEVK